MGSSSPDLLPLAQQHHRAGRLAEAEGFYLQVLRHSPRHPHTLHYLGLLRHQKGNTPAAIELMRQSIALLPNAPEFHNNLATVLAAAGQLEEALGATGEALRLKPRYPEAQTNRAGILKKLGRADETIDSLREAVRQTPRQPDPLVRLARMLADEAVTRADDPGAPLLEEALVHMRQAIGLRPRHAESHHDLGTILRRLGRTDEAIASVRRAIELRPDYPEAYVNLGLLLRDIGRNTEGIDAFRKAIALNPNFAPAHWNLSLSLLAAGDYANGWLEYEWRQHLKEDANQKRPFPQPVWNGFSLAGRTILLLAEQGLGDTIQFVRFAPLLKEKGATVLLECQPKLLPLMSTVHGIDRVIPRGEQLPPFDTHARLMTLPGSLGTTLDTLPAGAPYLHAEPDRVERWKEKLSHLPGLKIGIAWQGSKGYKGDAARSIPLWQFAALADAGSAGIGLYGQERAEARTPNQAGRFTFISLQKGPGLEQIEPLKDRFLLHLLDGLDDTCGAFLDTAAVMMNLDLVITSDTSIAHLAGALGVRTWLVLQFMPDWRWLLEREDCPWYPSMRLFRQRRPGDWEEVFQRIAGALAGIDAPAGRLPLPPLTIPIGPGELIDRLTILQLKARHIADPARRAGIRAELERLTGLKAALSGGPQLDDLCADLLTVNADLWQTEDDLRLLDARNDFGERFINLAQSVYRANDRRSRIKRQIDELLGSTTTEYKCYACAEAESQRLQ